MNTFSLYSVYDIVSKLGLINLKGYFYLTDNEWVNLVVVCFELYWRGWKCKFKAIAIYVIACESKLQVASKIANFVIIFLRKKNNFNVNSHIALSVLSIQAYLQVKPRSLFWISLRTVSTCHGWRMWSYKRAGIPDSFTLSFCPFLSSIQCSRTMYLTSVSLNNEIEQKSG